MRLMTQQLIKDSNMKLLYASIYNQPGISRTLLSKKTRLSKTTVSTLVDELIERRFIMDSGASPNSDTVGRKSNLLYARSGSYYVTVLHWEGNAVHLHMVDIAGGPVYRETHLLGEEDTYLSVSREFFYHSFIKKFAAEKILGVCIVVSAMIDAAREEVYSTTLSLPSLDKENLFQKLQSAFPGYAVAFLEDTACCAYAEKIYANIKEKNFAFINFSHGIGATLFIEGNMLGKASGAFTQFGHYSVDPQGPLCICGNRGCLEALISEYHLKERIASTGNIRCLDHLDKITFSDLGQAALYKDPQVLKLLSQMAHELALALGNLICTVNPSLIILGGKIPSLGTYFLEEVRKNMEHIGFRRMVDHVDIRYSTLNSDSFLSGAMKYFFDTYYCYTSDMHSGFFVG